jgi:hypothetical protein
MKVSPTPESLKIEHQEFREQLQAAVAAGGRTGEAAKGVLEVLQPHVVLEQELAMPPLTLLRQIAYDTVTAEMAPMMVKAQALKEQIPRMLNDHKLIVGALRTLMQASTEERHPGFAAFAQKLILHAQTEEEIFYPAAVLVGEYLKLTLAGSE